MVLSSLEDVGSWRFRTARNNIPVRVKERQGSFGQSGKSLTETMIIRASDLAGFIDAMLPAPAVVGNQLVYFQRGYPNGLPTLRCTSVSFKGFVGGRPIDPWGSDPDPPDGTYDEFLECTVDYATCTEGDQSVDPGDPATFLEVDATVAGEFLNARPGKTACFKSKVSNERAEITDAAFEEPFRERTTDWSVKWSRLPYRFFCDVLKPRIDSSMGKVNSETMPLFHKAPKDTIMLLGYRYAQSYSHLTGFAGQPMITVDLKFNERRFQSYVGTREITVTWQDLFVPLEGQYMQFLRDGTNPLYARTNLNSIFSLLW